MVGDYVYVGASEEDAEELLKLNNFIFAGARLEVVIKDSDDTGDTKNTIESEDTKGIRAKFESVLSQRYLGPPQKLLRLDALAADAELVNLGALETKHKPERPLHTFRALMAICGGLFPNEETQPAIESISLTNNGISDVEQVETVATTFPRLKHLDMSGNKISTMQGLRRWKGQFRSLETIYMTGNPIETVEPNYQAILLEWFPTLQNINGNQVRTPIPQDGLDFRDVGKIGENFLLEFFTSYDTDRQSLASRFYDETSQFSLAVDERSVRDPNAPAPKPWTSYLKFSRNMIRIEQQNARMQRLFRGANVIYDVWKALPPTRHPDIKQEMSKYIMDCHPLPGLVDPNGQIPMGVDGLIVAVHGEFEEADPATNTVVKRSFSRTFVLGPGQPGKGPTGIRVVSDMLSLRAYSPLPNIFAQASAEENRRQTMIVELSEHTRLRLDLSRMCLEQANWDYGQALVILEEAKKNVSQSFESSQGNRLTKPRKHSQMTPLQLSDGGLHREKTHYPGWGTPAREAGAGPGSVPPDTGRCRRPQACAGWYEFQSDYMGSRWSLGGLEQAVRKTRWSWQGGRLA